MKLFSEFYNSYYDAVSAMIKEAQIHPLSRQDLLRIIRQYAFQESVSEIPDAIYEERWPLLRPDGTTPIQNDPIMPLSLLQKRWLKAVSADPRVRLFLDEPLDLPGIEPLFQMDDIVVFDAYLDGDPYTDEAYIQHFHVILDALRNAYPLEITQYNRKEHLVTKYIFPKYLEYSEKDDKFRLIGIENGKEITMNVARILSCQRTDKKINHEHTILSADSCMVQFELFDERKSLERVLLHFAHFRKEALKISDRKYLVTLYYNKEDETEILIRILSFGLMIEVKEPEYFRKMIIQRLFMQRSCER